MIKTSIDQGPKKRFEPLRWDKSSVEEGGGDPRQTEAVV